MRLEFEVQMLSGILMNSMALGFQWITMDKWKKRVLRSVLMCHVIHDF